MSSGDVVLKEGFLVKRSRGSRPLARFQRRYFRLYHGELQYFYSPQETVPRRRIPLRLDSRVLPTNDLGIERCFAVKSSDAAESFYVQAESEEEKNDWVNAIFDALRRTDDVSQPATTDAPPSPRRQPSQLPPQRILLHMNIVEAKGLKGIDLNGKSDPYCVVNLVGKDGKINRSEEMKTTYVTDTLNPVWNQNFTLGNAVDLSNVEAIHLELWDHDHVMKNSSLGFVQVPLSIFQMSPASTGQSELVDRWFRVEPPNPTGGIVSAVNNAVAFATGGSSPRKESIEKQVMIKNHGELRVVMSIAGPNLVNFFQSMHLTVSPQSRIVTDGFEHTDNRLEVTVLAARQLIAADFNKSSDPYVELTLLDEKGKAIRGEFYQTAVKEKTRNPQWADEHHVFGRICRIDEASHLRVRVLDWDAHSKNDSLGCVVIDLDDLSANNWKKWYDLQPEPGMAIREDLGAVLLNISLIGETRGERHRRREIDKEIASKTHELSVEQLELENAQHQLHEAACNLDGARISCTVENYQNRNPQFYGINGCIHYLNSQLPRVHRETTSTDETFQARAGIEGQAVLEVDVLGTADLKKDGTLITATNPYAVIELDPSVCIEECKHTTLPQSPKRTRRVDSNTPAAQGRTGIFAKRAQAEVSAHRAKLAKNEVRSERQLDLTPDQPMLKVEIKSGHGLIGVDYSGYSDPYCTLTVTDRTTGKPVEVEKKRTAVISKTLNPVWENEVFYFGNNFPLHNAGSLIIHVKDHNIGRSAPLGRVQIPVSDLCHASATSTSITSTEKEKRYSLIPEPWMKKQSQSLGELCIKTEVIGDATVLAEMLQRSAAEDAPGKMLTFATSMQSFASDFDAQSGQSSMSLAGNYPEDDETTEIIEKGKQLRTATASGTSAKWRKERFTLSLSYPGMFSESKDNQAERYVLHLRVHGARNLLDLASTTGHGAHEPSDSTRVLGRRCAATNPYFTVIPVLANGQLLHQEKQQSLTVYGSRHPKWPDQELVFGKVKELQHLSYLSLHIYSRDMNVESTRPVDELLSEDEQKQTARLKRFEVYKLGPKGIVEDDGLEILPFDQRVMAYRKCVNGGRFFPARVQKYHPLPDEEYEVIFEDGIKTIDDLWDMFSLDAKGKVTVIHPDGTVDVAIMSDKDHKDCEQSYVKSVPVTLLKPVSAFTPDVERVMARRMDASEERRVKWETMKHTLTGFALEVLSTTGLPKGIRRPGCVITFLGNPLSSPWQKVCSIGKNGQLTADVEMTNASLTMKAGEVVTFILGFDCDAEDVLDQKRFEEKSLILGMSSETEVEEHLLEETRRIQLMETSVVMQAASVFIQIVDQGDAPAPSPSHPTIAHARLDFTSLRTGSQDVTIRLIPSENIPYYKYVGSIDLRIDCQSLNEPLPGAPDSTSILTQVDGKCSARCADQWFRYRMELEHAQGGSFSPLASTKLTSRSLTRIGRRRLLRSSLTPTENAQIDAFHNVLVVIMQRVTSILREIQLFESFEDLPTDEMARFRHIHSVNADPNSEWLGRPISEIGVEVRKSIVVDLEMELLDIAASDRKRVIPESGISRDEWVSLRTVRQQELQRVAGFFMQDRTSALVLSLPWCFTGEGMISWICRAPAMLWKDQWVKYCHDPHVKATCKLGWNEEILDPDALQSPRTRDGVLLWLNALADAGYIENVSPSLTSGDAAKKYYLVEDKVDRFYRLREVERWLRNEKREKSLFPLDLVPEIDCFADVDKIVEQQETASPQASPNRKKRTSAAPPSPAPMTQGPSTEESLVIQKRTYAKKLPEHVEGFLGLQNAFSGLVFSQEVQQSTLLKPVATKTQQLVAEEILWNWKYCLFIPARRSMYVYECEYSLTPMVVVDMSSTVCKAAYNFQYDAKGGWFNVANATILQRELTEYGGVKYAPVSEELRDKLSKVAKDGSFVMEFKSPNTQLWVQSFVRSGIQVEMMRGQYVVLKQLNPTVLQRKCIHYLASFDPSDLEGSYQRLLNKFFKHDVESSHQEHEKKMRDLRAKVRSEMKKSGDLGDAVMAYYGKGQRLNPRPTNERLFTKGALYSGRIMRIRTPFSDEKYRFKETYKIGDAPQAVKTLLAQYKVHDKESWLKLPKHTRDVFLLYDVEYRHAHEIIIEEGMLREHLRTSDGDLDAHKVKDRCTDLNLWFKPSDLEDCVTRMVLHTGARKPLGCLKIPIKTVSPHRVMDVWYPLAPENEMIQKANLGQVRVLLRLERIDNVVRSSKVPAIMMDDIKEAAAAISSDTPLAKATKLATKASSPIKVMVNDAVNRLTRRAASPTNANTFLVSRERSFLTVRILEGRKLITADLLTSDPFVKIVLIREKDDKEVYTKQKTKYQKSTLNPKWQNESFELGRSEETMLSDKKALILRVMDHDDASADDPMGYLKIEFQRDKSGAITGFNLVHGDEKGEPTVRALQLSDKGSVEVDDKLLADEKAGMKKTACASRNNAAIDGRLGKLRFIMELQQNENFVDPNNLSAAQVASLVRGLETKFSLEVSIPRIDVHTKRAGTTGPMQDDWKQFSCVFIPKGEGGQRIHYDIHSEDLGSGNTCKLSDLLPSTTTSHHGVVTKILGRTYDVARVAYFEIEFRHSTSGRVFSGRFGDRTSLKNPRSYASGLSEKIILQDKESKDVELHVQLEAHVVSIHRAQRLKRLLADTFRIINVEFDLRRINDDEPQDDSSSVVQRFLWEVCKAHVYPGRNTTQELLAQVHRMCHSKKLHWKYTPQLLGLVMEHIFLFGDKDRLSYDDAAALDSIMSRWSVVLQHLEEAKSQLAGHLHGKETPRLVHALMSECNWTGFEFASLPKASRQGSASPESSVESVLRPETAVHALLPARVHAGVAVDVKLANGNYVAGTVVAERERNSFDVAFCTSAKAHEEDDGYFSDDDELPPLNVGDTVSLCMVAYCHSLHSEQRGKNNLPGRTGRIKGIDEVTNPREPYLVEFDDGKEPQLQQMPRVWLDSIFFGVAGEDIRVQLTKDDYVRVLQTSTETSTRPAKIVKNHRNGKYDIEYLDEATTEQDVPRAQLQPTSEKVVMDGEITEMYLTTISSEDSSSITQVLYDVALKNGDFVQGVSRDQLRIHDEFFPSDKCILASVFCMDLKIHDDGEEKSTIADHVSELFAHDQLVKVFVMMPTVPEKVFLRHGVTNKILQSQLKERDDTKPRFVEQCHGYSRKFTDLEQKQLAKVVVTSALIEGDTSALNDSEAFDIKRCFCVYLAPEPRVSLQGILRITPDANPFSHTLFKELMQMAAMNERELYSLLKRPLRAASSEHMPLNRKERVIHMKSVKVVDRHHIDILFEVGVPHNNRGSLNHAIGVAQGDAKRILERLMKFKYLVALGAESSMDDAYWILDNDKNPSGLPQAPTSLIVYFLDSAGRSHSEPSLSVEVLPLDDQRLSVADVNGKSWEVCLPMDRILVEAQLRRHLVPHCEAVVRDEVDPTEIKVKRLALSPQTSRRRRDSQLLSQPTESLKRRKRGNEERMFRVRFNDGKEADVIEHDIKADTLRVHVLEASELTLKEKLGTGGIQVEVMLRSSDYLPHADGDQALKTPFGVILSDKGDICKDMSGNQYPQCSTQRLTNGDATSWVPADQVGPLTFSHPGIDVERVSGLTVRLLVKDTKKLIGTTFIPMSAVPVTQKSDEQNSLEIDCDESKESSPAVDSSKLSKKIALSMLTSSRRLRTKIHQIESEAQSFSLYMSDGHHTNVVGKIRLQLERSHCIDPGDKVLVRRLQTEEDSWLISQYELLALTLKQHNNQLMRGLLATSNIVPHGGSQMLTDVVEQELQLQKIVNVMLIAHAMELIYASRREGSPPLPLAFKNGNSALSSSSILEQAKYVMAQTKWFIEDTAAEFGIRTTGRRLPWSSDATESDGATRSGQDVVIVRPNVSNAASRVRRTMLKLYEKYRNRLIPTLQRLYEFDTMGDKITANLAEGEQLLTFFEDEVEDLGEDDQTVYRRVYRRIRLIKIAQVLRDIMHTMLMVTIMNHDQNMGDEAIGIAYIPIIDLLDRLEHDNFYDLIKKKKRIAPTSTRPGSPGSQYLAGTPHDLGTTTHGKVHLRLQLIYSESSLLEQATHVYRFLKDKYIAQYETARRRINAAVVPAQRRRWMTIKGYLEELKVQSTAKLHWQRTPVLLSLVWDIFAAPETPGHKQLDTDEEKHLERLTERASDYRSAVALVHKRWANVQPLLEELLQIQAATQIHAQRTPELLTKIESEIEGLDLVLQTAWQQVDAKWKDLLGALEELVGMKERNKLHMARAPQLLKKVQQLCSKGLNERHAEGVSNVQFRWMAITQRDGPLNELRLTERKGLHWRRTNELVLLLNEQCEGFADTDAKTLEIVQKRWEQVQVWLEDVVLMQEQRKIDCEATPFILKKMHLIESRQKISDIKASRALSARKRTQAPLTSPRASTSPRQTDRQSSDPQSAGASTSPTAQGADAFAATLVDVDRLEGLTEWYAIEESKRELERIPRHRIRTELDKNNQLRYFKDGKDTRLQITLEEMALTPQNVRAALVDRGVIPVMTCSEEFSRDESSVPHTSHSTAVTALPKDLLDEIQLLEESIESIHSGRLSSIVPPYVTWNPERVAELYLVIEGLGKSDLLWKIDHAVNTNHELDVPTEYTALVQEMNLRHIQTTEIIELVETLLVTIQKEECAKMGVSVPPSATVDDLREIMMRHRVSSVKLPNEIGEIQKLLQERGMDKKGEPVFLRGMRIGTEMWNADDSNNPSPGSVPTARDKAGASTKINTGLGLVDSKIEQLRKTLLMEALRKRNSLIKSYPGESHILSPEELAECTELDMSGDYMTLIERFQQQLIHESYTKRLAEYAAADRCMRALLRVARDDVVTKEDIAKALQGLGGKYRLPLEAFTKEELLEAASLGKIRTPTEQMLARCPVGRNANAMAYYAAVSYAALVFEETVRFHERVDGISHRAVDSLQYEPSVTGDSLSVPKNRRRMNFKEYVADWLLGTDESIVKIQRRLGAYHRQRLQWASAAFTLRNRWYHRGFGWCDDSNKCAGVKVLLQKLLLFENANKMHMIDTEALLSDINEKCVNLRARERSALEALQQRYATNRGMLDNLVIHAEKCINNRKLHAEETPALLHAIEQACQVPHGLHFLDRDAYHVVSTHWSRYRARLAELVHMHKQGTFSIERTPELLSAMEFHTEGIAGAEELDIDKVMATASASTTPAELQQRYVDKKVDEIRRGQRKQASTLRLNLEDSNTEKDIVLEDLKEGDGSNQWQSLSPSKKVVQPLSPHDKQTSWKVVTRSAGCSSGSKQAIMLEDKTFGSERPRKSSIGDDIKELLRSPSKWLMGAVEHRDVIRPEVFFPREVSIELSHSATASAVASAAPAPASAPVPAPPSQD